MNRKIAMPVLQLSDLPGFLRAASITRSVLSTNLGVCGAQGLRGLIAVSLGVGGLLSIGWVANAQTIPSGSEILPEEVPEDVPDIIEQTLPESPVPPLPSPDLPTTEPEPSLQLPVPATPVEPSPPVGAVLPLERLEIVGFTVLEEELAATVEAYETIATVSPFCTSPSVTEAIAPAASDALEYCGLAATINSPGITFEGLVDIRSALTELYLNNGYLTSGAFVPSGQDLSQGTALIQVVEGSLEHIDVSGLTRLQESYVRNRIAIATDPPLQSDRLEEALQLLQLDPLLQRVNAELIAGSTANSSILLVNAEEAPATQLNVSVDNYRTPNVGSEQLRLAASYNNLVGVGDRLSASYGLTEGLDTYRIGYRIPVNARDGTLSVSYSNNDSDIVADDFRDLGIRGESETLSFGFRQPISRSPEQEFALGLGFDWRRSRTFIFDEQPFSFQQGVTDTDIEVAVVRFSQEWVKRNPTSVLAARSQFSLGLDAFGATASDTGPDGQFFAWLGQFQWVQQLPDSNLVLLTQVGTQLTPDSLLSLERFSVGGANTVRGYAENQLVADNGIFGSVELRIPLTPDPSTLQIIPFFDVGTAWNNGGPNPDTSTIASLGTGLRWQPSSDFELRLDYGIPLIAAEDQGDSLQENGFHFAISYRPSF